MDTTSDRPSARARGPAGRVAAVQRQARSTLTLAGVFAAAAAATVVAPHRTGSWLPLHLFLAGTVLLAISAATQLFAVTWSAGSPPANRVAALQRWLLALSVVVLGAARELRWPAFVVGAAGAGVVVALVVLAASLLSTMRSSVQRRFDGALHAYAAALVAGVCGCTLGILMATDPDADMLERWRAAHLGLNLLGLVGLVIVGTLPSFAATQLRTKMSPRADRRAQTLLLVWLSAGVAATTVGSLSASRVVVATGLAGYAAGLLGLATLMPVPGRKQLRWAGPRVVQLGAGLLWWVGAVAVSAAEAARGATIFSTTVVDVLVVGAYAQIVAASIAYLAPVLRGGGHERLTDGFRATASWTGLVAANAAAVAIAAGAHVLAASLVGLWLLDTIVRLALLLRTSGQGPTAVAPAHPRP